VIIHMTRVRIAGPRALLDRTLGALQDLELVHVARPSLPRLQVSAPARSREARHLPRILEDVEVALRVLGAAPASSGARADPRLRAGPLLGGSPTRGEGAEPASLPGAVLFARRTRRRAERIARALTALEDERVLLLRYREFFRAFEPLLGHELTWPDGHAFYVVVRAGAADAVDRLRSSLDQAGLGEIEVLARPLASGETAVLLLASAEAAPKVGQLLAASRVQELPAPAALGETNLLRALPALGARLVAIPAELGAYEAERAALRDATGEALRGLRAWLHDRQLVLDARAQAHEGHHLFVLEGWTPQPELPELIASLARELGPEVLVEAMASEAWSRNDAPVALANPPLFKPFEVITRTLPLPRYGTIDPTPFVAVFFPMFFGLMLGDAGYGALLALLAVILRLRSRARASRRDTLRSIAAIAGACAAFSIVLGLVFGEVFGDLGKRAFGLRAWFDRETAILPFLVLAGALGLVHVLLGLVLAVVNAWRSGHRREALGRGVAAIMIALTTLALLAALKVLPAALFTPMVVAFLIALPLLILLEGIVAVIELLSNFGQILSYARIMALGTASLMLAIVANEMVGAMGSALVGVLFALLFHLVNFAIGLFSPTIHALRLHYVEFFGRFFSPGGTAYRPLTHWHPTEQGS
jgi:V/A-type H+-transporting ATPase subunit I